MRATVTKKDILVLFLLAFGFTFLLTPSVMGDELPLLHEKTFKVNQGAKLELGTAPGDVLVKGWDKNEVHIVIRCNDKAKENMKFKMALENGNVVVRGERTGDNGWFSFSNLKVKYEINVPEKFIVSVKTSGGDITLRDIVGSIELKTSGGDIEVDSFRGNAELQTSGGDIEAVNFTGDINAGTSGGDIVLKGKDSKINASTSGGDVKVFYTGENKGIDLSTSGGDIDLFVPANTKANINLRTSGGEISCGLPTTNISSSSRQKLEAEVNGGGEEIRCSTSGGDVSLKKN